jgi:organic hydroperoxide reductase OsmC/OhrA
MTETYIRAAALENFEIQLKAMQPYPHTYVAAAAADSAGSVTVASPQLPNLESNAPPQFDGPGGVWSPETLLCASVADCFILTFRALARAAKLEWLHLECRVEGLLERSERLLQFTRYTTFATLTVPTGTDAVKARELLERAEHSCLIANSLRGTRDLNARVIVTGESARGTNPQGGEWVARA